MHTVPLNMSVEATAGIVNEYRLYIQLASSSAFLWKLANDWN